MHIHTQTRDDTSQGKQGILFKSFQWGNTGNFSLTQGKVVKHREVLGPSKLTKVSMLIIIILWPTFSKKSLKPRHSSQQDQVHWQRLVCLSLLFCGQPFQGRVWNQDTHHSNQTSKTVDKVCWLSICLSKTQQFFWNTSIPFTLTSSSQQRTPNTDE